QRARRPREERGATARRARRRDRRLRPFVPEPPRALRRHGRTREGDRGAGARACTVHAAHRARAGDAAAAPGPIGRAGAEVPEAGDGREPVAHGAAGAAAPRRGAVGGDPQEVRAAGGVRRVRADRGADRHARAPRGAGGGVRLDRIFLVLLCVPDRRRGAGEPAAAARVAGDVAREPGAGGAGPGPHGARVRHPHAVASPQARPVRDHRGRRIAMRILDRYLLREFLTYLVLGLMGFIVIFIVVDLIEKMDVFLDHKAPWFLVAQYFLNLTPDVVVKMLPVALLLATFLALGQLNK